MNQQIIDEVTSEWPRTQSEIDFEAILEAGLRVMDGRALSEIREDEVSEAAGIPIETVRIHFEDNEALLHALLDRLRKTVVVSIDQLAAWSEWRGRSLPELVREVVVRYVDFWRRYGGLVETLRTAGQGDPFLALRHAELDREVEDRIFALAMLLEPDLAHPITASEVREAIPNLAQFIRGTFDGPAEGHPSLDIDELTQLTLRNISALTAPDEEGTFL